MGVVANIFIALVVGIIIAAIIVGLEVSKLKSVAAKQEASDYVKQNSLKLSVNKDVYLYKKTERTARQQNQS